MRPLRLEPLAEQFADDITELLADPDVMRFTRVPDPPPADYARTWIARYEAGHRDGDCAGFAAIDAGDRFVGLALAPSIDRDGAEVELGYVVAPSARGQGVASEILRLLTGWAFEELGARRIVLIIDVENPVSERVAVRCGYMREGVMRSTHLKQGIRVDAGMWSKLR